MTPFEFIIIILIYLFFYGYTVAMFFKEENVWLRAFLAIMSLVLALYAPLFIGVGVFEKLKNKDS